jgi:hypothetical protein
MIGCLDKVQSSYASIVALIKYTVCQCHTTNLCLHLFACGIGRDDDDDLASNKSGKNGHWSGTLIIGRNLPKSASIMSTLPDSASKTSRTPRRKATARPVKSEKGTSAGLNNSELEEAGCYINMNTSISTGGRQTCPILLYRKESKPSIGEATAVAPRPDQSQCIFSYWILWILGLLTGLVRREG